MIETPMRTEPDGSSDEIDYSTIKNWLRERDWPVTSTQLGDHFGISQQAAYYRLRQLKERGEVERNKYGQTVMWRLTAEKK
jgi:Mn-dependent DtxR family transcriptional regulator